MFRLFASILCLSCALAGHSLTVVDLLTKVVNMCQQNSNVSLLYCIKERSLIALDHVYRSRSDISIVPNFVSLSRYNDTGAEERSAKILPEELAGTKSNKSSVLDGLILGRLNDFVRSRAISIKVPIRSLDLFHLLPASETDKVEGRGRINNRGMLAMGAMMAGTMIAMKLAAVAAIAGKALMASMMAIMLASLAALSKKGPTHGSTYEVINVPSHGHHARRSLAEAAAYSDLANRPESSAHRSESTYGHRAEPTYHRPESTSNESYEVDMN